MAFNHERQVANTIDVGKRLAMELGTHLHFELEGVPTRLRSVLIGMEHNEYLVVKAPKTKLINGIGNRMSAGAGIVVRYVHQGSVFAFSSQLLGVIKNPVELMFIKMPDAVEEHQIRSAERIDCYLPATIDVDKQNVSGTIIDISRTGCQCVVSNPTAASPQQAFNSGKTNVLLRFHLPEVEGEQHLTGDISNLKKDVANIHFGIKFDDLVPRVYTRLLEYLLSNE